MKKEQYEHIENTLRELALFIRKARVEEEKENFKKLFYVVKDNVAPLRNNTEASKLNNQLFTQKENKEMPFLKDLKYRKLYNGIHQFRYRRDGYNVSFNSKNLETAKDKARKFIISLKKDKSDIKFSHLNSLSYVANAWLELKKPRIAQTTHRIYAGILKNHILPKFGNKNIKNILPMDLQPFFNELSEKQGKTAEDCKNILNGIFNYAIGNRLCPTNPMQSVIVDKHIRVRGKALNSEQIDRFIQSWRIAVALDLLTLLFYIAVFVVQSLKK